jgi:hypothetical protein
MNMLSSFLIVLLAFFVTASNAQTTAPAAPAKPAATGTVKALQPGLFEVSGPRVNDAVAAGITKITATPGKGMRAIHVESPWGDSYNGWPKNLKPVAFTITTGKGGAATISAPGFTEANKADYKAAIEAVVPFAIANTQANKNWAQHSGYSR